MNTNAQIQLGRSESHCDLYKQVFKPITKQLWNFKTWHILWLVEMIVEGRNFCHTGFLADFPTKVRHFSLLSVKNQTKKWTRINRSLLISGTQPLRPQDMLQRFHMKEQQLSQLQHQLSLSKRPQDPNNWEPPPNRPDPKADPNSPKDSHRVDPNLPGNPKDNKVDPAPKETKIPQLTISKRPTNNKHLTSKAIILITEQVWKLEKIFTTQDI